MQEEAASKKNEGEKFRYICSIQFDLFVWLYGMKTK